MPVTPREILDSAVALGRGKAEVDWRNACSRAYYAGFHRCRQIANALEPHADTAGPGAHRVVADILTEPSRARPAAGLGYTLRQCRGLRNAADYDVEDNFPLEACLAAIQTSEDILARADGIVPAGLVR